MGVGRGVVSLDKGTGTTRLPAALMGDRLVILLIVVESLYL